ncbi:MAG TPA: hypothetical protein VD816_01415 [Ohtaekwangia sp.]|nr:hypothetical protein [Ohtaekwangia sp.]
MKILNYTIVILLCSGGLHAQTFTEKITRELSFGQRSEQNTLIVANINGDVNVTGYDGDKIVVEINKSVRAKTEPRLAKGKAISLGVIDRADTVILFVNGLCTAFNKQNDPAGQEWGYQWNQDCQSCHDEFDHTMDFTIRVPRNINLIVSTVNDGNIAIGNMKGAIVASNVNGSIDLQNLERAAEATTINGDVHITYAHNPDQYCRFYTLNGDINAWFQKGLAANLSFESFNGSFYTNIEQIQVLPAIIERSERDDGTGYKISGNRYKVGTGGTLLDFETFNGNVYLKEKTN